MKSIIYVLFILLGACSGKDGRNGQVGTKGDVGLQGEIGPQGPIGLQGVNGTDNKIVTTFYCHGITPNGLIPGIEISYWASITSLDDVWVSAEVGKNGVDYTSSSRFYSSEQVGSQDGAITIRSDWYSPYNNGGFFHIKVNRLTKVMIVTYTDSTSDEYYFPSSCIKQDY